MRLPFGACVGSWYPIGYHRAVTSAAVLLRTARTRAGLTLRGLAARAGTSHATLARYEAGAKIPRVDTLLRVLEAAGFALDTELERRPDDGDRRARGRELVDALLLASQFPVRHGREIAFPPIAVAAPVPVPA